MEEKGEEGGWISTKEEGEIGEGGEGQCVRRNGKEGEKIEEGIG